ncbi:MAG: NnrU family protein [Rhodospirillaceae bacterium]|nr:NnrU family protein [Rhodospirillaceae bacterium]
MTGTTDHVLYAAIVFLAIHLVPGTPLRGQAVRTLGEGGYRGVFSLASLVALAWMALAFRDAPHEELWDQAPWTRWVPLIVMPLASILFVCGLTSRNPSLAGMERAIDAEHPVAGIITVTRHPMLWSFALWALAHLPPNGDRASLYLFGSLALLALAGMPLIDRRKGDEIGNAWGPILMRSSAIPFLAALQGRTAIDWRGIGWWRVASGLFLYALIIGGHRHVLGVDPWP